MKHIILFFILLLSTQVQAEPMSHIVDEDSTPISIVTVIIVVIIIYLIDTFGDIDRGPNSRKR